MNLAFKLDLDTALDRAQVTKQSVKELTGYSKAKVDTIAEVGLDIAEADHVATCLGMHPTELWPNWFDVLINVAEWREADDRGNS